MGLSFLEGLWPYAAGTPPKGAYPVGVFQEILRREEARVERNAHMFSLVLFQVPEASRRNRAARILTAELSQRIRFTDVVGCYDDQHIGVLLPETGAEGARNFVEAVASRLGQKLPNLDSTIQPFHPPSKGDEGPEDSSQLWLGERRAWSDKQAAIPETRSEA